MHHEEEEEKQEKTIKFHSNQRNVIANVIHHRPHIRILMVEILIMYVSQSELIYFYLSILFSHRICSQSSHFYASRLVSHISPLNNATNDRMMNQI